VSEKQRNSGTLILSRPVEAVARSTDRGEACLVLLHPPGPDIGRRTPLTQRSYVIGRENADLVIPRSAVSRQHSTLSADDAGDWWIADLGSTNGTFVNEERIERRRLADGDQVRFGDAIFKFLNGQNIESAYIVYFNSDWEFLNEAVLLSNHLLGTTRPFRSPMAYTQLARKFGIYRPYFRYQYISDNVKDPVNILKGTYYGPSIGIRVDFADYAAFKLQFNHLFQSSQPAGNGLNAQLAFTF